MAVTTDVMERKREEQLRMLGQSVANLIADAHNSSAAIQAVIRTICEAEQWECGRYLQPSGANGHLYVAEAWGIDEPQIRNFLERWRGAEYQPGGLAAEVWQSGQPIWTSDVSNETRALRRAKYLELGLRGAFMFPVKSDGEPIGVLAFNTRQSRAPDEPLLQAILAIGSLIGQFLQRKRAEERLREREAHFRSLTELSSDWYWEQDADLRFVATGGSSDERGGITPEVHIGKRRWELPSTAIVNQTWEHHQAVLEARQPFRDVILRRTDADGQAHFVTVSGKPVFDEHGVFSGYRGVASDVTARVRAEEQLRESEARFRSLCALSSDVFWEQDAQFRFTVFNDAAGKFDAKGILGKTRWEQKIYTNMSAEDWRAHRAVLEAHQPFRDQEFSHLDPDGNEAWYSVSGEPVFDSTGAFKGYRGVGREITVRKLDEKRIRYLANHDSLTGLPNRTCFGELLNAARQTALRNDRSLAVMFVDLDRFKLINDTLGHGAGDQLLCEAGKRLRETLRASDIVARLGGDEFVVVVPEAKGTSHIEAVAQKILGALAPPVVVGGQECTVTASIGISLFPKDGEDEQTLMKNADTAMYRAKEAGKNNYQFYSVDTTRDSNSFERLAMEASLRRGLQRNEFFLHYQPVTSLATGEITGVEALVRWQHPDLGLVPPAEFIPLAEETGIIVQLGSWVLRTACAQAAAWQRQGLRTLRMAVNVSARQFANEDLVIQIAAALDSSGFNPKLLELELTESVVAQNVERATMVLGRIKNLGVRLALDDFGTGYSSLAQLKRFPIDTLKIDRSFVTALPHDEEDAAITKAIIAMGRSLEVVVIAEGVETPGQRAFLAAHGCHEMQGYLFQRPLTARECTQLLRGSARVV